MEKVIIEGLHPVKHLEEEQPEHCQEDKNPHKIDVRSDRIYRERVKGYPGGLFVFLGGCDIPCERVIVNAKIAFVMRSRLTLLMGSEITMMHDSCNG